MMGLSKTTMVGIGLNLLLGAALFFFVLYRTPTAHSIGDPSPGTALSGSTYRIAYLLHESSESTRLVEKGLLDTAVSQGNPILDITTLDANGDVMRLQALAEKAVADTFDVIVPLGTLAAQLVREVCVKRGSHTPVVFCGIGDPVKAGLTNEYGKSWRNLTGFGVFGFDFVKPMIDQLPLFAPHVKNILIPYNPNSLGGTLEEYRQYIGAQLEERGYHVVDVKIYHTNDVVQKVQAFIEDVDMVWLLPDATMMDAMEGISKLCVRFQKFSYFTMNLNALGVGSALAFGYSMYDVGRNVGRYVCRLLVDGAKIDDLPVVPVAQDSLRIGINLENARQQGLFDKIPATTLYLMEHGMVFEKEK